MTAIDQLPVYILTHVFSCMPDMKDYLVLRETCKRFKLVLANHHPITPTIFAEFQKCQRKLYQVLTLHNPCDDKWDLSGDWLGYICDLLKRKDQKYGYRVSGAPFGQRRMPEQKQQQARMEGVCSNIRCSNEYGILGYERVTLIYNDAMYKMANSKFTILDLSNCKVNDYWDSFFAMIRQNTNTIKFKKLVLSNTGLTDLTRVHDIQDLLDDCCLYLDGNNLMRNQFQGVISGVAQVFGIGQCLKKDRLSFRDNRGQAAMICHS